VSTAYRIFAMERVDRLRELSRSGVEVVHWEGERVHPGVTTSVDVSLTALARQQRRRR
jgi:hypothetical protein